MSAGDTGTTIEAETRRRLAVETFNHVWTLLDTADRTADQIDEMIHGAHASRYLWGQVGDATNRTRGEWQCSRVYAVLGRAEPARYHAQRCLDICQQDGIADWDLAVAYEALARACRVAGDADGLARNVAALRAAMEHIEDPEDRDVLAADLATLV